MSAASTHGFGWLLTLPHSRRAAALCTRLGFCRPSRPAQAPPRSHPPGGRRAIFLGMRCPGTVPVSPLWEAYSFLGPRFPSASCCRPSSSRLATGLLDDIF